jgi:hypothetical protein
MKRARYQWEYMGSIKPGVFEIEPYLIERTNSKQHLRRIFALRATFALTANGDTFVIFL